MEFLKTQPCEYPNVHDEIRSCINNYMVVIDVKALQKASK